MTKGAHIINTVLELKVFRASFYVLMLIYMHASNKR